MRRRRFVGTAASSAALSLSGCISLNGENSDYKETTPEKVTEVPEKYGNYDLKGILTEGDKMVGDEVRFKAFADFQGIDDLDTYEGGEISDELNRIYHLSTEKDSEHILLGIADETPIIDEVGAETILNKNPYLEIEGIVSKAIDEEDSGAGGLASRDTELAVTIENAYSLK